MFLQQTAAASLVALFLLILQRIFLDKLSPRWQYGVWFVLLLRLLVPAGALGRWTALDVSPWLETLRVQVELGLNSAYSSPFAPSLPHAPIPFLPGAPPLSWTDWLFLLYWAGVLLWAGWFLLCALGLSRRVGQGVPVEGTRRAAVEELAGRYRLPCPKRIVECRWGHSPFVAGVIRPTLVLPMGWALDETVILHELLHLKYRDVLAGWLTTAFRCIHWCNPFLWQVFDKIGNDREALCDQRVLERLEGEARRDYGRVLLAMADDQSLRTPGATTMANGARAVKARIEAIARFQRFPKGMELVSGCIIAALSLSLVAGMPAAASGGEVERPPDVTGTAGILARAAQNRATTVAGALDAYGKALYHRYQSPDSALLCAAMVTSEEGIPALLEARENSFRERVEDWELLDRWWRTGPVFRGLISDGEDGYLCQVFWFRDAAEEELQGELPLPEGETWPVEYLCHTVRIRPDGRYWTVEKLSETQGPYEDDLFRGMESTLYGPVTWRGEADGLKIELSPAQVFETGDGTLGRGNLRMFQPSWGYEDPFSFLYDSSDSQENQPSDEPMPHLQGFRRLYSGLVVFLENTGAKQRTYTLEISPHWDDPELWAPDRVAHGGGEFFTQTEDGSLSGRNVTSLHVRYSYLPLDPGEPLAYREGGAGGYGGREGWDGPLRQYLAPDSFTALVTNADRETFAVALTPRYTTPDGGTFSLDREEGAS